MTTRRKKVEENIEKESVKNKRKKEEHSTVKGKETNKKKKDTKLVEDCRREKWFTKFFTHKFSFTLFDLFLFTVAIVAMSSLGVGFILHQHYKESTLLYGSPLSSDEHLSEFIQTYSDVIENYYEEVDGKELIAAAMSGMMSHLQDNYSIYLNTEQSEDLNTSLSGTYQGIGILASGRVIVDVYKDSPASKAGLEVNDEIIKVNGTSITDENYTEISTLLQNDSEKENTIVIKRDGKEKTFTLSVDTVTINTVTTKIIEKGDKSIGYLSLGTFSSKSHEQFEEALLAMEEKGISSLIIDLRGNSGGYLNVANHIGSLFLEKGALIYSLESKNEVTEYKDKTSEKREYPIVVLVNGATASAAEILASALKDSYGATIVGKQTFGKGKVQTIAQYEDSMVKYTSAKWLRPNGECIDAVGIFPDYEIANEMKNYIIYDKQLDKAIDLLK